MLDSIPLWGLFGLCLGYVLHNLYKQYQLYYFNKLKKEQINTYIDIFVTSYNTALNLYNSYNIINLLDEYRNMKPILHELFNLPSTLISILQSTTPNNNSNKEDIPLYSRGFGEIKKKSSMDLTPHIHNDTPDETPDKTSNSDETPDKTPDSDSDETLEEKSPLTTLRKLIKEAYDAETKNKISNVKPDIEKDKKPDVKTNSSNDTTIETQPALKTDIHNLVTLVSTLVEQIKLLNTNPYSLLNTTTETETYN